MSKKRGIQYDVVAAVANVLVGQGFKADEISAGAIREETGTGSLTTIMAHLNRWRSQSRPAAVGLEITADNMAPIAAAVTALIKEASDRVREEERKAGAAAAIEADRVRVERDDALALNEEIEAEREAAVEQADALRVQVEQLRLSMARLEGELEAFKRAFPHLDRTKADPVRDGMEVSTSGRARIAVQDAVEANHENTLGVTGEKLAHALATFVSQPPRSSEGSEAESLSS